MKNNLQKTKKSLKKQGTIYPRIFFFCELRICAKQKIADTKKKQKASNKVKLNGNICQ